MFTLSAPRPACSVVTWPVLAQKAWQVLHRSVPPTPFFSFEFEFLFSAFSLVFSFDAVLCSVFAKIPQFPQRLASRDPFKHMSDLYLWTPLNTQLRRLVEFLSNEGNQSHRQRSHTVRSIESREDVSKCRFINSKTINSVPKMFAARTQGRPLPMVRPTSARVSSSLPPSPKASDP